MFFALVIGSTSPSCPCPAGSSSIWYLWYPQGNTPPSLSSSTGPGQHMPSPRSKRWDVLGLDPSRFLFFRGESSPTRKSSRFPTLGFLTLRSLPSWVGCTRRFSSSTTNRGPSKVARSGTPGIRKGLGASASMRFDPRKTGPYADDQLPPRALLPMARATFLMLALSFSDRVDSPRSPKHRRTR